MVKRLGLVAVWLVVAAGCGSEPVEETAAVRLLDIAPDAKVRWPRLRQLELPRSIEGVRTLRGLRTSRAGRVAMFPGERDGDSRAALIAPSGTRYDFEVTLPPAAELRLSLGYVPPPVGSGSKVSYSVFITTDKGGSVLLDEEILTSSDGGWVDHELDLAEFAGQTVELTLRTKEPTGESPVWAAWGAPELVSRSQPENGPDVILIVLDTLRADRLSSYGYHRPTSPSLDALAARSIRFTTAVSQAPWTKPSHIAMFSGNYPSTPHRDELPVLAEVLREAGYRTEAFTGGGQVDFRLGFSRGFDAYRVQDWINEEEQLTHWLSQTHGRKRFLFLHTYEIHDPYNHDEFVEELPEPFDIPLYSSKIHLGMKSHLTDEHREFISDLYDGGIAYVDRKLGELFGRLEESGALDRSIVVVTSDHGEQFWEHGSWRHGMNLYDHQLLVPLIVYLPPSLEEKVGGKASRGRVVSDQVRLVDLMPTLADLTGIGLTTVTEGRSIRPLLAGETMEPVEAFAERLNVIVKDARALRSEKFKYVGTFPTELGEKRGIGVTRELYDLTRDPGESNNLAEQHPDVVKALEARLDRLRERLDSPDTPADPVEELDPDLRERLEALGYIGG